MGELLSKIVCNKKPIKIVMMGQLGSGKTTILYKLVLQHSFETIPTIRANVETITHKNMKLTVWDLAGSCETLTWPQWRHSLGGMQGLVFVVDSTDRDSMEMAQAQLHRAINEVESQDYAVLIFANKQDLPNAMKPHEIEERLKLSEIRDKRWYIQPSCAKTKDGLYEGFEWLTSTIAV